MKKKVQKILIPAGLVAGAFALGLFFGLNSWNKNLYVQWTPSQSRGLAQVGSPTEILNFSPDQLSQKASSILLSNNQVIRGEDTTDFYLGNFMAHDPSLNKPLFVCQIFPFVELSFLSAGVNLSGESGMMLVRAPCLMEDIDFIGPFRVPHKEILAHPEQKSFEMPEEEIFIHFYHTSVLLADNWLLKTARFFKADDKEDEELLIRFVPGKNKPYFEFSLKDTRSDEAAL